MELFKVVVAGGRTFNDLAMMTVHLNALFKTKRLTHEIVIISGTARGADQTGEQYADNTGATLIRFPADWDTFGKSAGYIRNKEMAEAADAVVVFWDGKSKGSNHMIQLAKSKGLPLRVIKY